MIGHYKLSTDSTEVDHIAELLERAGARNVLRGTEHVSYSCEHSPGWDGFCLLDKALNRRGASVLRPLYLVGKEE